MHAQRTHVHMLVSMDKHTDKRTHKYGGQVRAEPAQACTSAGTEQYPALKQPHRQGCAKRCSTPCVLVLLVHSSCRGRHALPRPSGQACEQLQLGMLMPYSGICSAGVRLTHSMHACRDKLFGPHAQHLVLCQERPKHPGFPITGRACTLSLTQALCTVWATILHAPAPSPSSIQQVPLALTGARVWYVACGPPPLPACPLTAPRSHACTHLRPSWSR